MSAAIYINGLGGLRVTWEYPGHLPPSLILNWARQPSLRRGTNLITRFRRAAQLIPRISMDPAH